MASRIERPLFYENQILGASDLTAAVEYSRSQQARHERSLHLWGIASGLELTGTDKQTAQGVTYQEITLSPGIAIDGTGREIVIPEAERLSEDLFDQLNVAIADTDAWYPVFVTGRDEPAPQPAFAVGACHNAQPTRRVEGYDISFGRPGDELDLDTQQAPDVTEGPGSGEWKMLLGFVQWDASIKRFKTVGDTSGGIGRRYDGVQADVVAARSGQLTLRTRSQNETGKPAIFMAETDGGLFQFGALTAQGVVTPVFSVTAKGDIKAEGTITGAVAPGSVQIQSGVATDGIVLPLPPGITEEQVTGGQVTLHIHLTPRFPGAAQPTNDTDWVAVPFECRLEGASRRVLCRFRWFRLTVSASNVPLQFEDRPGACNYIVMASVPAASGG
jgi:hypothetical protein